MRTLLGAVLVAAGLVGAAPAVPAVTAVVSFDTNVASPPAVDGVRVVSRQPHVRTAVVRGTPTALYRLAHLRGVRGVAPDAPMRPTSHDDATTAGSVFAWEKVGGPAGEPGAGAGVGVALVDTGVSNTPALRRGSGRLVDAVDTSGENELTDGYGHGTFMAGVVAGGQVDGTGDHGLGVAPGATVYNVKVADHTGVTSLAKVVAGLDWVAGHAGTVQVASFAFSRTRPGNGYGPDPLTDAVERVRDAGVTVVVSAGNVAGEVGDPGFDPRVLTIGAADLRTHHVTVAPFSGRATVAGVVKPDVVGSGVGVLSVLPRHSVIAEANPGARRTDLLWRGSGTSQATAQAAGVAALFLAAHPGIGPASVKASVRFAATSLGNASGAGAGLVRYPRKVVDSRDGAPGQGSQDWSGEGSFDANSWSANSWSANSWSASSWSASSWSASSWSASSWSAVDWTYGDDD